MTILIVTNSNDPTADLVQKYLDRTGVEYIRLNTDKFFSNFEHVTYISNDMLEDITSFQSTHFETNFQKISSIWYRRPVNPDIDPSITSAQVRQYVQDEGYYYIRCLWKILEDKRWVSKPESISWASVKLHQLRTARGLGLRIPRSLATTVPEQAIAFFNACKKKVVVKPFTTTTLDYGEELVSILTSRVTEDSMANISQVKKAITFFQEEVPKQFEIRVTVIGQNVFSAAIDSQSDPHRSIDWRSTSPNDAEWYPYEVPSQLAEACKRMVKLYNLNFGTFDFAYTPDNEYVFFELNPNGQWAWQEIQLGYKMTESLVNVLER